MKILNFILTLFSTKEILSVVNSAISCLKDYFQYKKTDIQTKKEQKEEKKQEDYERKLEDVVKNGDVQDLLNLKK